MQSVIQLAHSTMTTQLAHTINRRCYLCIACQLEGLGTPQISAGPYRLTLTVLRQKLAKGYIFLEAF